MAGPFKMKGSPMQRNFGIGVSPMKNDKTATGGDPKLEKLKAKRIANTKAGKIIKFGEGSNIIADKGPIDPWSSEVKKAKKVVKKGAKVAKKVAGKVAKFAGSKALGVLGFMSAGKTATADQPKFPKGSKHYQDPKKKIDFSKSK